jgi:4-hydroxy-tetrahydrodipicolinate synthase
MKNVSGVRLWSAVPTPLTADLRVDASAAAGMIRAALADGLDGVFLAGTCGEGPWLTDEERSRLVRTVAAVARGRLKIGVQVTDNSVPRVVENIRRAAADGADIAIIAPPAVFMNATPERLEAHFIEATDASPLPIGIYDLGRHRPLMLSEEGLAKIYARPNVLLVKDSSGSPTRRVVAIAARANRPALQLFNGDEFRLVEYVQAGYDGCMFGGMVAIAAQVRQVIASLKAGQPELARGQEQALKEVLFGIYGGEQIACWLTGLKYYMVRRGIFHSTASFLGYPLTPECREFVEAYAAGQPALAAASH